MVQCYSLGGFLADVYFDCYKIIIASFIHHDLVSDKLLIELVATILVIVNENQLCLEKNCIC